MADGYYGQAYEQGGIPGALQATWLAPGRYASNAFQGLVGDNPLFNQQIAPPNYGELARPERNIFEELFLYNPGRPMPEKQPGTAAPSLADQPQPSPASPQKEFGFTLPGALSSVTVPKAPDTSKLDEAIANLKGPGKKKTDAMATIMQALATTRWDDRSATGTNLFNIGAALLGGAGLSRQEAAAAEEEANRAQQAFELQKVQLQQAAGQQQFQNELQMANLGMRIDAFEREGLAPKISGNNIVYGVKKPNGDVEYKTEQIGPNKYEQMLGVIGKQMENTQVDVADAVMRGQVPPAISAKITPKLIQYQQQAADELGASLSLMDDTTKRNILKLHVNQLLMEDPELKDALPILQQELKKQAITVEALKRSF